MRAALILLTALFLLSRLHYLARIGGVRPANDVPLMVMLGTLALLLL